MVISSVRFGAALPSVANHTRFGQKEFGAKYVSAANTILDAVGKKPVESGLIANVAQDRRLDLETLQEAVAAQQQKRQSRITGDLHIKKSPTA